MEPHSVRWEVRLTKQSFSLSNRSLRFRFRDTEWCMRCATDDRNFHVCLWLCPLDCSHSSVAPFNVSVQVEDGETGRVLSELGQKKNYQRPNEIIWRRKLVEISQACPEFRWNLSLTFVVTFEEMDTRGGNTGSAAGAAVQPYFPTSPWPEVHSKTFASASVQTSCAFSCLDSLAEDLSKLLDQDSNSDVELRCEGVDTAMAHKAVLSARSPVFASMLKSDMVEGKTGVVSIRDMDADTFRRFLRYAYTGKLDVLTVDSATSLYEAGDMYGVKSLAKRCSDFLIENLTVENACDVLALADAHSDAKFVEAVTAYILEGKVPLSGDRWPDFCASHPVLANQVLNLYFKIFAGPGVSKK